MGMGTEMKYDLCKNVMNHDKKRNEFDALLKKIFGLSFEKWYQNREWGNWNQPYTLFDQDKAIANVTVNHMKVLYEGRIRDYIQLGGVATDHAYRGQGLSRFLMEEVLKDWEDKCDAIFLLANNSVTEFYPRFGFVEETQYQYVLKREVVPRAHKSDKNVRKLNLLEAEDKEILLRCYKKRNPYSAFQFIDNISLLLFYCYYGMDRFFYYLKEEDAVVIAEHKDHKIFCYDIYCEADKSLLEFVEYLWDEDVSEIRFLFTPLEKQGLKEEKYEDEDTHLFVLNRKENLFSNQKLYVPDISHT